MAKFAPLKIGTQYPGVTKKVEEILADAINAAAPENPALQRLFGVTREDLFNTVQGRTGNITDYQQVVPGAAKRPKGSAAVELLDTTKNKNRLVNILSAAMESADPRMQSIKHGMVGWYAMDPAYQRILQLVGGDEAQAAKMYNDFNAYTSMSSPGTPVHDELMRGTAANMLAQQGRFGEFEKYAGQKETARGADFPSDIAGVPGHPYHSTAQAPAMRKYLETGALQSKEAKVPTYNKAAGVPETGFQTIFPVGDAHFSRGIGLADTRTVQPKDRGASATVAEMQAINPIWQDVTARAGTTPVGGQGLMWGVLAPQTGVESTVGATKLEILSNQIMKAAKRLNVSPEEARDLVLSGKAMAGTVDPKLLGATAVGSGAVVGGAAYAQQEREKLIKAVAARTGLPRDTVERLPIMASFDEAMESLALPAQPTGPARTSNPVGAALSVAGEAPRAIAQTGAKMVGALLPEGARQSLIGAAGRVPSLAPLPRAGTQGSLETLGRLMEDTSASARANIPGYGAAADWIKRLPDRPRDFLTGALDLFTPAGAPR